MFTIIRKFIPLAVTKHRRKTFKPFEELSKIVLWSCFKNKVYMVCFTTKFKNLNIECLGNDIKLCFECFKYFRS